MSYVVPLLYYFACVFTINKTCEGLAKILSYRFVDRNMYFLFHAGN